MHFPKVEIFSFDRVRAGWMTYKGADGFVSYNETSRTIRYAIKSDEFHDYKGRAIEYLKSLLRKCGEVLHTKGQMTFPKSKVVVTLPDEQGEETVIYFHEECPLHPEWVFYELMAQVSGVSVYKALAPKEVNGFVRIDHADDDHGSISYTWQHSKQQQGKDVLVGAVSVELDFEPPRHQEVFSFWVSYIKNGGHTRVGFSGQVFNRCMTSTCQGITFVQHSSGISSFSIAVPYRSDTDLFPRLAFLEKVTSALREAFPAVHGDALEAA
jgi:hypothetical protein